jgi:RNA polymerase sigma factor (sigma-70 family)
MDASRKLLADYVKNGSEAAFRDLVSRYINLVHSTAIRLVNGDTQLADDVTQSVFVDLARKAHTLPPEVMLGGWLHRDACFVAGTMMRGERRRHFRERQAVAMNVPEDHTAANLALVAPVLDEAINQLEPEDRTAILLRFFEQLEFRAVGQALGSNEDAARMRVSRALDKLHTLLKNRGVALSIAALSAALAAEAVTAAPLGLAAAVAGTALGSAATSGAAATLLKFMTMTKLKIAIVGAIGAAALAVPVIMQHQSLATLRQENQALQDQTAQMATLQAENERLSNLVAQTTTGPAPAEKQVRELARLRAEVDRLRDRTNALVRELTLAGQPDNSPTGFRNGKRYFHNITMAAFARFIGEVLEAPVHDETGLTGTYDITMTPPRIGPEDEKVPRVTGILRDELGLQLMPFAGPFWPDEAVAGATNGGFSLEVDHGDAPGLKPGNVDPGANSQALTAGMYYSLDTPGLLPPAVLNKLRLIDASTQQWALEFRKQSADRSVWSDIQPYLPGDIGQFTNSPDGTYLIGAVSGKPMFSPSPAGATRLTVEASAPQDPAVGKRNACINNLRLIDSAKQQWALENRKQNTDTPAMDDLRPYIGRGTNGELPSCPDGGIYTVKSVAEPPTCSVAGHVLP